MKRTDIPPREQLTRELTAWLEREHGVRVLGPLGFENAYALAMRGDRAASLGVSSIGDLTLWAQRLQIGGDFEFFARPEWQALHEHYALDFKDKRQYQSTFMYKAVVDGEVDVISAFSSDGRIAALKLAVLSDPKHAIPPYDALILISGKRARDATLIDALTPLVDAISIERMRQANMFVDRAEDKWSPSQAAAWLAREARLE